MRDWAGKRYWVVGAGAGLGREVALALSRLGATVVVSGRDPEQMQALAASLPGRATALPLDVTDRRAVEAAGRSLGEVDGLAYLADVFWPVTVRAWDADRAEEMSDVNYRGALRCVGAVLPGMLARGRGHVVLSGSPLGARGRPRAIGYGASKAAVRALAESLRAELWRTPVAVQLVTLAPGVAPEVGARAVVEHMNGDAFALSLPLGSAWGAGASRLLPEWAYLRLFAR